MLKYITQEYPNFEALSIIEDIEVLNVKATIVITEDDRGKVHFTQTILDYDAYSLYMDEADDDYMDFQEYVIEHIAPFTDKHPGHTFDEYMFKATKGLLEAAPELRSYREAHKDVKFNK